MSDAKKPTVEKTVANANPVVSEPADVAAKPVVAGSSAPVRNAGPTGNDPQPAAKAVKTAEEPADVETPVVNLVEVEMLDSKPRYFQNQHVYVVLYQEEGYLVPVEHVVTKDGRFYVDSAVLENSAFKLYSFETEIKNSMPTWESIRNAMWLEGAYGKEYVTRNNIRGKFPALIKV